MWKEFKEFALKGNVIDMAVGVVIGGAFGKIVTSIVNDIIMPPIGVALAGVNFADLKYILSPAVTDAAGEIVKPEAAIGYGAFIQTIIDFILVALCVFLVVKFIMSAKKKMEKPVEEAPEEPAGPSESDLLTEIRDLLKAQAPAEVLEKLEAAKAEAEEAAGEAVDETAE